MLTSFTRHMPKINKEWRLLFKYLYRASLLFCTVINQYTIIWQLDTLTQTQYIPGQHDGNINMQTVYTATTQYIPANMQTVYTATTQYIPPANMQTVYTATTQYIPANMQTVYTATTQTDFMRIITTK